MRHTRGALLGVRRHRHRNEGRRDARDAECTRWRPLRDTRDPAAGTAADADADAGTTVVASAHCHPPPPVCAAALSRRARRFHSRLSSR